MGVTVRFRCDGCEEHVDDVRVPSRFVSVSGRDSGFGCQRQPSVASLAPDGWMPFDPWTGCCYCPECWASIVEDAD